MGQWVPLRRVPGRRRALLVCNGAVAAVVVALLFAFAPASLDRAEGLSATTAFVGSLSSAPARALAAQRLPRVALRAEDAEIEDFSLRWTQFRGSFKQEKAPVAEQKMESVFDGPTSSTFRQKFAGKWFEVDKADWTYILKDKDTGEVIRTGAWARAWNMPEKDFDQRQKGLKQQWRAKKRKLRIKHGMGEKWPNGKYIFLAKLQGSPFTREQYGEKYVGRAAWHFSPKEVENRERTLRALELKRRLEQEAEQKRVSRLAELGVWPGNKNWRRPWQPKVASLGRDDDEVADE